MNFTLNIFIQKMVKNLCWEKRSNGRYCKNYRLDGKTKCKNHGGVDDGLAVELFLGFILITYFTLLISVLYADEKSVNEYISHVNEDISKYVTDIEEYILYMTTYVTNYIKLSLNL